MYRAGRRAKSVSQIRRDGGAGEYQQRDTLPLQLWELAAEVASILLPVRWRRPPPLPVVGRFPWIALPEPEELCGPWSSQPRSRGLEGLNVPLAGPHRLSTQIG